MKLNSIVTLLRNVGEVKRVLSSRSHNAFIDLMSFYPKDKKNIQTRKPNEIEILEGILTEGKGKKSYDLLWEISRHMHIKL